ncbi:MAG: hypothetical protein DDT26_00290 [Dehalococcoidia bacterium]|nr:hypothetical protein [Chloroflexota bacterium]
MRAKSREIVHATFRRPAIYTSPEGVTTRVLARLHNRLEVFGDLGRDGYAKRLEEVNQIVFDSVEIVPRRNGVVDFGVTADYEVNPAVSEKYEVVSVSPAAGDRYIKTEVTLLCP